MIRKEFHDHVFGLSRDVCDAILFHWGTSVWSIRIPFDLRIGLLNVIFEVDFHWQ